MALTLSDIAYAKLNLALHVRARRADGYHDLETLFAFVDDGDRLSVAPADALSLTITGPFAEGLSNGANNLVMRAALALRERAGLSAGAAMMLDKRLPVASGIGGGSADAAAVLRLLVRLWGLRPMDLDLPSIAVALGADVPACIASRTVMARGIGADFDDAAPDVAGMPVLLVNPLMECPTGPVFAGWDGADHGALDADRWPVQRNDLEQSAITLCPDIADVLTVLRAQLPRVARMSGSGATCFATFGSVAERDAAAERIEDDHPDWWVMAGALR